MRNGGQCANAGTCLTMLHPGQLHHYTDYYYRQLLKIVHVVLPCTGSYESPPCAHKQQCGVAACNTARQTEPPNVHHRYKNTGVLCCARAPNGGICNTLLNNACTQPIHPINL